MHTVQNTDLSIIIDNCTEDVVDKHNNCVLLITGALNPIHRSHIKNIQLVKSYLENHPTKPLKVLAAYLSPTHDSYVRNKLDENDWIPADKRIELCKEVIKSENLEKQISVTEGECRYDTFADFDEVTMSLAEFLNYELCESRKKLQNPLTVVYVCGLDHFNKCSYVTALAKRKNIACAVIYRLGASDRHITMLKETLSNIYYITLDDEREALVDISSTKIRKSYRNSTTTDSNDFTYPCVHEYLRNKYHQ